MYQNIIYVTTKMSLFIFIEYRTCQVNNENGVDISTSWCADSIMYYVLYDFP